MSQSSKISLKSPEQDGCPGDFYQTFKKEWIRSLPKLFQTIEMEGKHPKSFNENSFTLIPKPGNDPTQKQKYRPESLMNTGEKKTSTRYYISNRTVHWKNYSAWSSKWDLFLGCKGGSIFTNQSTWYTTLIRERIKILWSPPPIDAEKAFDKILYSFLIKTLKKVGVESNVAKAKQSGRQHSSGFQAVLKSCNHQDCMVLAEK